MTYDTRVHSHRVRPSLYSPNLSRVNYLTTKFNMILQEQFLKAMLDHKVPAECCISVNGDYFE